MKTLILGTGIIGTIYGWALAEAGVDVTHLVRRGKCAERGRTVTLDVLDEREGHEQKRVVEYARRCVEGISLIDKYELIILPVNSFQIEDAIRMLLPDAGHALFLVFGSNWEGEEFIRRLLPKERYLLGYPDAGGTLRNDLYWVNIGPEVHLGQVNGKPTEELRKVQALFAKADVQADVQENLAEWLWLHNAMSIPIWAGFAKYPQVDAFLADRPLLIQCFKATQELLQLCRKRGVGLGDYPETVTFRRLPAWLFVRLFRRQWETNESMERFTAHAADSLPEAKAYYEAMMETARELSFEMPNMQAVGPYLDEALRRTSG
jgi:ketopantoate reductase